MASAKKHGIWQKAPKTRLPRLRNFLLSIAITSRT